MLSANFLYLWTACLIFLNIISCETILDYRSKFVKFQLSNETMKEVDLGFSDNSRILTYVDFRDTIGDKSTDIIISELDKDGSEKIKFYFYEHDKGQFLLDDDFDLTNISFPKGTKIKNLSAMDINNDERIDLIITFQYDIVELEEKKHVINEKNYEKFKTYIYLGEKVKENPKKTKFELIDDSTLKQSEFLLADINGDRLLDFIYYEEANEKRKVFYFEKREKKVIDFADLMLQDEKNENCLNEPTNIPIGVHHSSAFVDINGDCVSDLLIHSKLGKEIFLEIWIGMKINNEIKYCLKEKKKD